MSDKVKKLIYQMQYNLYFCTSDYWKMTVDIANSAALLGRMAAASHKVATVAHTHPDGDAAGSSIGMACWLESLGKEVRCIFPDPTPSTIDFVYKGERKEKTLFFSKEPEAVKTWLQDCDLIVVLDMNDVKRSEGLSDILKAHPAPKVLVDHHLEPSRDQFALTVSETEISSASELVYWLLKELCGNGVGKISLECASALMTGMTTDTNNFANSTWPSTLEMASQLLAMGVDRDFIVEHINWHYGENRLRALGMLLGTRMAVTPEGVAYMVLYKEDTDHYGLEDGDTEGFVNMPLAIAKVRMSILLKEDKGYFRISIRSKKGTSAATCATKYFHGGGHENASGGKLFFPQDIPAPADAPQYVQYMIKDYFGNES